MGKMKVLIMVVYKFNPYRVSHTYVQFVWGPNMAGWGKQACKSIHN